MSNVTDLPDVSFCETDTETVEADVITVYEGLVGVSLADGDPVRLFLAGLAAIIAQQRVVINNTGKGNLLYYADGSVLDYLGEFYGLARLAASQAGTTVRFELPDALSYAVVIPAGTRVSPDGTLMFETTTQASISAGSTAVSVSAICQTAGDQGNDYAAGAINMLVDVLGYGLTVENTTVSSGGQDEESDDSFKERIYEAPESFSIAGPTTAYEHFVKSVRQDIVDVAVYVETPLEGIDSTALSTIITALDLTAGADDEENRQIVAEWLSPSNVHIVPLLENGGLPDESLLALVEESVGADDVRPLTDKVYVSAPETVGYDIDFTYYVRSEDELSVTDIQSAVAAAVDEFSEWQCAVLGRALNPSKLIELIREAGAGHVVVASPVFTELAQNEVATLGETSMAYGGLKDGI